MSQNNKTTLEQLTPFQLFLLCEKMGVTFEIDQNKNLTVEGVMSDRVVRLIEANKEELQCVVWCKKNDVEYCDLTNEAITYQYTYLIELVNRLYEQVPQLQGRDQVLTACGNMQPAKLYEAIIFYERCLKHCENKSFWRFRTQYK